MQELTLKKARLSDTSLSVRGKFFFYCLFVVTQKEIHRLSLHITFTHIFILQVDICYRLIEQQTLKLKEMNSILVNLLQSKEKKKEQNLMVVEDNKNEK